MKGSRSNLFLTLLISVGCLRIVSTYFVFSNTVDEPAHIACGLEWLDRHTWTLESLHPPLARVLTALGPWLMGERSHPELGMWAEGFRILGSGRHYDVTLALARLGILPLFCVAAVAVSMWARRLTSRRGALFAVLIFTTTPPVLAHAGLATTDFALAAFSATSALAMLYFMEPGVSGTHTALRAVLLGFSLGLAISSKFSALVFLPAILLALLLWRCLPNPRRPDFTPLRILAKQQEQSGSGAGTGREMEQAGPGGFTAAPCPVNRRKRLFHRLLPAGGHLTPLRIATLYSPLIGLAAFATVWSVYRFSFSRDPAFGLNVPFPELFAGLRMLRAKNAFGSPAYLCGRCSLSGFWYYFPAVLSFKTPLGTMALLALGICLAVRRDLRALLCPLMVVAAVLIVAAFSRIDIGVRHVLAVYPALSVAAGISLERALNTADRRGVIALAMAFLLWHLASGALAHPDYLAYTNELALPTPENVLVDSDLDWGQDMKRLALRARQLGIHEMAAETMGASYVLAGNAFPKPLAFDWQRPAPGWNAVSVTPWKLRCFFMKGYRRPTDLWPDKATPVEKIGKSTYLFFFPPKESSRALADR